MSFETTLHTAQRLPASESSRVILRAVGINPDVELTPAHTELWQNAVRLAETPLHGTTNVTRGKDNALYIDSVQLKLDATRALARAVTAFAQINIDGPQVPRLLLTGARVDSGVFEYSTEVVWGIMGTDPGNIQDDEARTMFDNYQLLLMSQAPSLQSVR